MYDDNEGQETNPEKTQKFINIMSYFMLSIWFCKWLLIIKLSNTLKDRC